jgi:hypothetical protein
VHTRFWWGILRERERERERDNFEDLGVDGRIILKRNLRKLFGRA